MAKSEERAALIREEDRRRMMTVIGTYLITQRDRGVLDEDAAAVLEDVRAALLAQEPR